MIKQLLFPALLLGALPTLAEAQPAEAQPQPIEAQPIGAQPATQPAAVELPDTASHDDYSNRVWEKLAPQPGGLTSAQAAASAQNASPAVAVANAKVDASLARTRQTLSRYVPNVTVQGIYRKTNQVDIDFGGGGFSVGALNSGPLGVGLCPDGMTNNCVVDSAGLPVAAIAGEPFELPTDNYSVQLDLSIPFSDYLLALPSARKGAAADEAAANLQRDAELETAGVNARIAYYDWIRAQAQLSIAEEAVASAEARLEDGRIGLQVGTVTSADALGLESLVASSKVTLAQAKSFVRLAEQNLIVTAQLKGPLTIGEDLSALADDVRSLGDLPSLIQRGQKERVEVKALKKTIASLEFASEGASSAQYPRLDGFANVTHANPNQAFFPATDEWNTSWYVGLNLSWRLDGFLNSRAQSRELDANAALARAQSVQLARGIELEVRAAWEEWVRADEAEKISKKELEAAIAMHEQRILLFKGGEATSTEVVEAELQRHNATMRKVNASIDKRVALAKLRRAAAIPFEGEVVQ